MLTNAFYASLKDFWYTSQNHSIALLRAENAVRTPWVIRQVERHFWKEARILDLGCGAGWLSNSLALHSYEVTGVDSAVPNLNIAHKFDRTRSVRYIESNPDSLPFADNSFEVVCAMDILEHVDNPVGVIKEISRVLRPGGIFLFHTYNRNLFSFLLVIKGLDWFVHNAPRNRHDYNRFIKPSELTKICKQYRLKIDHMVGFQPDIWSPAFWKLLRTRIIPRNLEFTFCSSLLVGYSGVAKKERRPSHTS